MPTLEHKQGIMVEYQAVKVTLDDGFTCMIYFDPREEEDFGEEYLVALAEQRRETRSSWKMEDNIKRGYYNGSSKESSNEDGIQESS